MKEIFHDTKRENTQILKIKKQWIVIDTKFPCKKKLYKNPHIKIIKLFLFTVCGLPNDNGKIVGGLETEVISQIFLKI